MSRRRRCGASRRRIAARGLLGLVPVARHDLRAARDELADLAGGQLASRPRLTIRAIVPGDRQPDRECARAPGRPGPAASSGTACEGESSR